MDLNLEQAFEEPVDLSHEFDVPSERLEREELLSMGPVSFQGRLQKADAGFVLSGQLRFGGTVACARCLGPVPFEKDETVSWVFAPAHIKPLHERADRPDEDDAELEAGDLDVIYYDDLTLPFDPLIEEQLQLEMPMKALCRDDCRGLCPQCGNDRNVSACSCVEPADTRWSALQALPPRRN
jgi:uncharacterized protein